MMNLYKAGEIDAVYNHIPPAAWIDHLRRTKDHMDKPECAIDYYMLNTTKPPMDDIRVRKAFNMSIDKVGPGRVPAHHQAAHRVLARRHFSRLPAADRRSVRSGAREAAARRGRLPRRGRQLRSVEVPDFRSRAHLQHHRAQPADCGIRPGAMEAEPRA